MECRFAYSIYLSINIQFEIFLVFQTASKPVIVIQCLLHGREWVTLPVALWAIQELVINNRDPDLLRDVDWIILPIANPDGYEFTHARVSNKR